MWAQVRDMIKQSCACICSVLHLIVLQSVANNYKLTTSFFTRLKCSRLHSNENWISASIKFVRKEVSDVCTDLRLIKPGKSIILDTCLQSSGDRISNVVIRQESRCGLANRRKRWYAGVALIFVDLITIYERLTNFVVRMHECGDQSLSKDKFCSAGWL